jgi:hypothetical protein
MRNAKQETVLASTNYYSREEKIMVYNKYKAYADLNGCDPDIRSWDFYEWLHNVKAVEEYNKIKSRKISNKRFVLSGTTADDEPDYNGVRICPIIFDTLGSAIEEAMSKGEVGYDTNEYVIALTENGDITITILHNYGNDNLVIQMLSTAGEQAMQEYADGTRLYRTKIQPQWIAKIELNDVI